MEVSMHTRPILAFAALSASAALVSIGCSGAPADSTGPELGRQATHYTQQDIGAHQIVDLKAYLTAHPDLSPEQALDQLNRPIKLEPGHFLLPKDLRLPERCMSQLDVRSSQFVADFEICIVEPSLFDPAEPDMQKMAARYLALTGQAPDTLGSEQEALLGGTGSDPAPTIFRTGVITKSCIKTSNCRLQTVEGLKCNIEFFGLKAGCGAYVELRNVCDACYGEIVCEQFGNSEGGSFERCGECQCK
jgi:hypothetical protein